MEIETFNPTKEMIINIAKDLFIQRGYMKTTIRQISQQAGFKNQSSIYYYFQNKEEIATTLVSRFYKQAIQLVHSLNIPNEDSLLFFSMVQLLLFHRVYLIKESRHLVTEVEEHLNLKSILQASPFYNNLVYNVVVTYATSMSIEKIHYYINIYLAGINKTFKSIDDGSLDLSLDEAVTYLEALFLELIGIEKGSMDIALSRARQIYDQIDPAILETLNLF